LFATANTLGLGDSSGLYHGTQQMNQGQMDRWHIFTTLNYLAPQVEREIVLAKVPTFATAGGSEMVERMVAMAGLVRGAFVAGELSTVMSPRTVISWAQNTEIFGDVHQAFALSFGNRCDEAERPILAELYQRCFGVDIGLRSSSGSPP
jgi:cobaltochelatase CobS